MDNSPECFSIRLKSFNQVPEHVSNISCSLYELVMDINVSIFLSDGSL